MLIKLVEGRAQAVEDDFVHLQDDEAIPEQAPETLGLIVSLARFEAEGDAWLSAGRKVGVRLQPGEPVEGLVYDLPRLSVVALAFPKFRDGRAYSSAALLRERYAYAGEVRAVGDVLREQASPLVRCGFDAFEPADGSSAEDWDRAAFRFHHVYQAAADHRPAAFKEREAASASET